jgi:hypothetical protein
VPTPGAFIGGNIRVIGLKQVQAKLLTAAPNILAHNRAMIAEMLREIKPMVEAQTPLGPGHFGYHLRDRYVTDVSSRGVRSTGVLKSPPQGFWREWGTVHQRRLYIAHKALSKVKGVIRKYYGGMNRWWGRGL